MTLRNADSARGERTVALNAAVPPGARAALRLMGRRPSTITRVVEDLILTSPAVKATFDLELSKLARLMPNHNIKDITQEADIRAEVGDDVYEFLTYYQTYGVPQ